MKKLRNNYLDVIFFNLLDINKQIFAFKKVIFDLYFKLC